MSWVERISAPTSGTEPYDWNSASIYECTWYAYWRVQEGGGYSPPCWYSGSGSSGYGAYTNAKYWLDHYRSPWQVKDTNYTPVPGDIVVFTGTYGHVVVIESVNLDGSYVVTDYNLIAGHHTFGRKTNYIYPNSIQGASISTGPCIGCLHYPSSEPPGPGPTETLQITVTPSSYSVTMGSSADFVDFPYSIVISGIPGGETVSGGNTYPGLSRIANTGWSYSDYTVGGVTYRTATKQQTLRYTREHNYPYSTTKHMYFNISKSTGTIDIDIPMYIDVAAKINLKAILAAFKARRRKRGRYHATIHL